MARRGVSPPRSIWRGDACRFQRLRMCVTLTHMFHPSGNSMPIVRERRP